ncbi:MAG: Gfo/Idh/MocA family oxidoreductase [Candidatus Omnitrophica bacterium]|nr:Gfo/Idh/MocA family oxidoreductase [Candidatus Omnitrophota bacterium]
MKVLMVGLGGVGQRHLRNLKILIPNDLEVVAYRVRRSPAVISNTLAVEGGISLEEKYHIRAYTDLQKALEEEPEATFIANPSSLHIPVAREVAKAGCHLFIEKPLSDSLEGVDELIETVERNRLVAVVGYQLRFHPCLGWIRELLKAEAIGHLLAVRLEVGEHLPSWHSYEDYRQMYAARKALGGGVILSQIHEMDYVYSLFGMPRRVFALGGKLSRLEIDVEDTASILMECQWNGNVLPVHLHQDFLQKPPSRRCEIVGDAGKIVWDYHGGTLTIWRASQKGPEVRRLERFERNQLFLNEVKHFLACIRGEEKPIVTLRDGANSLKIALAAKQSLEKGEVISVHESEICQKDV